MTKTLIALFAIGAATILTALTFVIPLTFFAGAKLNEHPGVAIPDKAARHSFLLFG